MGDVKSYWCVMKVFTWGSVTIFGGIELQSPPDGPLGFMPLFETYEQAVKWNGSEENVFEMRTGG